MQGKKNLLGDRKHTNCTREDGGRIPLEKKEHTVVEMSFFLRSRPHVSASGDRKQGSEKKRRYCILFPYNKQ